MESGDQQPDTDAKANTTRVVTPTGASPPRPQGTPAKPDVRITRENLTAHYGHTAINRRIKEWTVGVKQVCSLSKPDADEPEWAASDDSDDNEDEDGAEEASVGANVSENDEDKDTDAEPHEITVGAADTATWHQQWDHTGKLQVSSGIIGMPWHSLINRLFPLPNANQTWKEKDYYAPIALLLNAISLAYARCTKRTGDILGVILNPNDTFPGDVHNSLLKPDVFLFWTNRDTLSRYLDQLIAWDAHKNSTVNIHLPSFNGVVSPGEVKAKDRQAAIAQTKSYLNIIKRSRPDLAEIFGFSARAEGFQLWKLDPCECLCTREYKWVLYSHFVEYFEVLYNQTPSKILVPVPSAAQLYKFRPNETSYYVFPFIATSALGRMTWVGLGYSISAHLCIIKLSWIDVKAWDEFDIYEAMHKNGWLPGVARHIEAGIALENPTRITWPEMKDAIKRRQRYIVLGSVGDPLNMCESVLDFLMVMHDVLETLEMLHKTGVMHRDLSWTNILCNPRHQNQTEKQELEGEGIGKKLDLSDKGWRSLLIDFDHGLLEWKKKGQPRAQRTGTPMFMATDLASLLPVERELKGSLLRPALECIPTSPLKAALSDLYGRVEDMATRESQAFRAKLKANHEPEANPNFENQIITSPPPHSLLHEAESVFWITVFGLVRALPEGFKPEPESSPQQMLYDAFCHMMLNHHIGDASEEPGRESYKTWLPLKWASLLHPSLKGLAPMLHAMGKYLAFAWGKMPDHGLGECHVYQIMKALLVVFIQRLHKSEAIKLNTYYPRPANPKDENERRTLTSEAITSSQIMPIKSNKRAAEPQNDLRPAKRQKKDAAAAEQAKEPSYLETVDLEGEDFDAFLLVDEDAQCRQLNEIRKRRWYMMSVQLKGGQEGRTKGT